MSKILTEANVKDLIGKTILWKSPAFSDNQPYTGKAVIKSVDFTKRNPIETDGVSGDNLSLAFLGDYGLVPAGDGDIIDADAPHVFCYSDLYREVEVVCVED